MEIPGPVSAAYFSKLKQILQRNPGFDKLKEMCALLEVGNIIGKLPWIAASVAVMIFAPMTTCPVERSFSAYKTLTDNGKRFASENLEIWLVVYCNQKS